MKSSSPWKARELLMEEGLFGWEAKLLRKDWPRRRPLLFAFPVCYLISNWLFVCDSFKEGSIRLYSKQKRSFFHGLDASGQRSYYLLRTQRLTKKMGNHPHEDQKTHSNALKSPKDLLRSSGTHFGSFSAVIPSSSLPLPKRTHFIGRLTSSIETVCGVTNWNQYLRDSLFRTWNSIIDTRRRWKKVT